MPLPTKTYYIIREPKICASRDIGIHIILDSATACFQRIIDTMTAVQEVELWGVAVDQCGYISTEWLIYSYSRASNKLSKHGEPSGKQTIVKEPSAKSTPHIPVLDISAQWEDIPEFILTVSY
jgi:hypothetical protein